MNTDNIKQKISKGSSNITRWSIEHPYAIMAFYTGVFILAVIAILYFMPRRMMPYVQSPMIGVVTMMPGLSSEEMETYISKPIEENLVNVKNLHYIRSISQEGFSIVSLEFNYGTKMKEVLFDVQSLMNVIQGSLPVTGSNLKPSWVLPIDPLNIPILSLSLKSEGWDMVKLREFADNEVTNRLKTVKNVYSIVNYGGYRRQLQVIVDKNKLSSYGLSILDVRNAVDKNNVSHSGGTLTYKDKESIIRFDNRALDANSVMNYPLSVIKKGTKNSPVSNSSDSSSNFINHPGIVYIKDVANVVDSFFERRSAYHFVHAGKIDPSIEVSIIQDPEASSALVVPAVMNELKKIEADYPGIKFEVAYDNAHFINILFKNMFEELGIAILLTGIAVLLFLGEWRGTVISLITIPTSLSIAILGLIPFGMTLNSGTLIGLLVSIGRLVDDSIIDIHAVERHLKMGKDPKTATIEGITEVRLAVMSSTFMLCLALSPLLFCGGVVELMFKELVMPIILALLSSMLVSFTLTSLLSAKFLKNSADLQYERRNWFYTRVLNPFQNFLNNLENNYSKSVGWALRNRFTVMSIVIVLIITGYGFYNFIGSEMMPLADVGQAYGVVEAVPGTSFEAMEKKVYKFETILLKYPEIEKVSAEIGAESMFESFSPFYTGYAMPLVNVATFMFTFSDKDERKKNIWNVMDSVQQEALSTIPGLRRVQIKEMGSDVMASSSAPIQLLVYGKDFNILDKIGEETGVIAKNTKGMYQTATSWAMENPTYKVKVDLKKAMEAGLKVDDIASQSYYSMRGGIANEFYRLPNIKQNTVLIRYAEQDRKNVYDMENMYIAASDGRQIPLNSIAEIKYEKSPTIIEHDGLRRIKSISGFYRLNEPPSMDLTMDIMMKAMAQINFPPGYGLEARGDMTQMMDSFSRLLYGLCFAVILMYLVLVAQFKSFIQPFQMVISLPLELFGVFLALFLLHQNFSTVSIMAVIILSGMDITTAILMIDMIILYEAKGLERNQAIIEAAPQRLRPIIMTSLITIIVMTPVSLFPKTGMDAYSPLGTVIIGGLIVGTLLSLYVIPVMYTFLGKPKKLIPLK